jgi:hypothetical protein
MIRMALMNSMRMERTLVNVSDISAIGNSYPDDFINFCKENSLTFPKITTGNGKALWAMLNSPGNYWNRETCHEYCSKFNIQTKDSIQLFNKHEQWGIATSKERGKNYIQLPYQLSSKHKMRKDFKFDGTVEQKYAEIEKIKSTIKTDYVDVPNEQWQLGHKNPESEDSSNENLVLQPPIQAKYRDHYVFIDTLTKIPTPAYLIEMIKKGDSPYTDNQLRILKQYLVSREDL